MTAASEPVKSQQQALLSVPTEATRCNALFDARTGDHYVETTVAAKRVAEGSQIVGNDRLSYQRVFSEAVYNPFGTKF